MHRLTHLLLILLLVVGFLPSLASASSIVPSAWQARVDPQVLSAAAQGETEFLVYLNQQADLSGATAQPSRLSRRAYVVQQLTSLASRTQAPLLETLQKLGVAYRSYWIANLVWVRASLPVVQLIAQRPEVGYLYANPSIQLSLPAASAVSSASPQGVELNIQKVNAPAVWAAGYTGQGVVIAGQDTGYDWTHPAIKNQYRGWNGTTADHNYNWHDAIHENNSHTPPGNACGFNSQQPCDDYGHGTHTMGTMVGDDGAGNQIGMAPGARWIGCRNMEDGWGQPSTYTECFQWFLAPTDLNGQNPRPDLAPDVINNSWSCPTTEGCSWDALQTVVDNVRAAGIVVVVSAGNSGGQGCGSVNEPPAIYASVFSIGATDLNDNIASFSSRGPATPTGLAKPDVSAPGVSIRSSLPGGGYGPMSGTSMAAPHVTGLAALLLSARPDLRGHVDFIQQIIEQSAVPLTSTQDCTVPGSQVPNNVYGWGRIDTLSAYRLILPFHIFLPLAVR